jgi:hypothetical protein
LRVVLRAIVRYGRRPVLAAFIAAFALVGARPATPSQAGMAQPTAATCGVERWTVKTLQDRPRLLRARTITIAHLVSLRPPRYLPPTRLPFEYHVFTVVASVTLVRLERDSDFHLVLRQGASHMIAEAPAPGCISRATRYRRRQMANSRTAVRLCPKARVTGVVELHPILDFVCLAS